MHVTINHPPLTHQCSRTCQKEMALEHEVASFLSFCGVHRSPTLSWSPGASHQPRKKHMAHGQCSVSGDCPHVVPCWRQTHTGAPGSRAGEASRDWMAAAGAAEGQGLFQTQHVPPASARNRKRPQKPDTSSSLDYQGSSQPMMSLSQHLPY